MKPVTLALMGVSVLAAAMLGFGGAAPAALPDASGFQPHSVQIISQHLNLRPVIQGRISETVTYQTTDTLAVVLAQYLGRYQPEPGQHKPGQCVILSRTNSYLVFRQSLLVTLCPFGNGTRVVVFSDLFMAP